MGDSTKSVGYEITAENAQFVKAMEGCASATTQATAHIKSQLEGVGKAFEAVQKQLVVLAAIVAGGSFFKDAIAEANKLTGETMNLSKRLGMTAADASALNTALGDIGSDSDTYISAFDKFAKQSLKISTVASLDQAFVMLEKGRAQYLIYEDQPGWAHVGQKKITGMKALKAPVSNEELYLTVSQMSSCNVGDLRGKLSKALYKLKKDDVMTKLLDKHQQIWRQQNTAP